MSGPGLFLLLVGFVFHFLALALWIRMFLMQPTSFMQSNPVADIVMRVTNPLMGPVERALKRGRRKTDLRPLVPLTVLVGAHILVVIVVTGTLNPALAVGILRSYLHFLAAMYLVLVFSFTVLYKHSPYSHNSIIRLMFRMVEPLFEGLGKISRIVRDHIGAGSTVVILLVYGLALAVLLAFIPNLWISPVQGILMRTVIGDCLLFLPELATFFMYVVIAGALMSWVSPDPNNAIVQLIHFFANPLNRPARRLLPTMGGIDFSPIVTIVALAFLARVGRSLVLELSPGIML